MKASSIAWIALSLSLTAVDSVAEPPPSASAAVSAEAKVEIPPWREREGLPAFDAEGFSDEKTKAPKLGEWGEATEVHLSRVSPTIAGCHAFRLHEWMKIQCDTKTAGLRLLAGSTDGIALWVAEALPPPPGLEPWQVLGQRIETMGRFGAIVFPVRRGDRRIFEWFRLDTWEGYDGPPSVGSTSSMVVEEVWPEGAKPEIALLAR